MRPRPTSCPSDHATFSLNRFSSWPRSRLSSQRRTIRTSTEFAKACHEARVFEAHQRDVIDKRQISGSLRCPNGASERKIEEGVDPMNQFGDISGCEES